MGCAPLEVVARFLGSVVEATGTKTMKINVPKGTSLEDLVDILVSKYGPPLERLIENRNSISTRLVFMMNGKSIHLMQGMRTKLSEGSHVTIVPLYMGG